MGILHSIRLWYWKKRGVDPILVEATDEYKRGMAKGKAEALKHAQAIWGGLNEREMELIVAADIGLIQIPVSLAPRLKLLRSHRLELERIEAEANIVVDEVDTALTLLSRQSWWPDFIASVQREQGIQTADNIGRWRMHGKRVAPYLWECGFVFQTPESVQNDGPVSVWKWRVDLESHTTEQI